MVDDLDIEIIKELRKNGRLSYREIARKLGVSPATIQARISRMEKEKIIENYHADIDYAKIGYPVAAIIAIISKRDKIEELEERLLHNRNVFGLYEVTGEYDLFLGVRFKSMQELSSFIKNELTHKYVDRSTTFLILKTEKEKHTFLE
jgi:Lrp/AsnC family transcriptional regulator for asnA, asnC and gidA